MLTPAGLPAVKIGLQQRPAVGVELGQQAEQRRQIERIERGACVAAGQDACRAWRRCRGRAPFRRTARARATCTTGAFRPETLRDGRLMALFDRQLAWLLGESA